MSPERFQQMINFEADKGGGGLGGGERSGENPKLKKYLEERKADLEEKFAGYEFNGLVRKGDPEYDGYRAAGTLAYGILQNSGIEKEELNKMPVPEMFRRAQEIYQKNQEPEIQTASEFETGEENNWYEGIVNDLRKATDTNISFEERQPAREELKNHGIDLNAFVNEDPNLAENRFLMVRDATEALAGNYNQRTNRWGTREAALDFLEERFGITKAGEAENGTKSEHHKLSVQVQSNLPEGEKNEGELENSINEKRERFLSKMDLVLMDRRMAEERGLAGDRRQSIQDLEKTVNMDFVFGADLDEDEYEGKKARKTDLRRAVKSMRNGFVSEEQEKMLADAGIRIEDYGVEVRKPEVPVNEAHHETESTRFSAEFGCSKEEYDRVVKACFDQIFINKANNVNQVLSSLTEGAGEWVTIKGRRMPLPPELRKNLLEMKFEAWIGIRNVMDEWGDLKNVEEITPASLKQGLFVPRFVETAFGGMQDRLFPKMTNSIETSYKETELTADIGQEVSKAMRILSNYFSGSVDPDNGKYKSDYWPYVSSEASVRANLYESLGLNRYMGEAAFAFLLSNFILAEKGVGLDSFSLLIKPAEKRMANYEVSEERDPFVRMLVQENMQRGRGSYLTEGDRNKKKIMRASILSSLRELIPARLVPTGLDDGGDQSLEDGNWIEWRNRRYVTAIERKNLVDNGANPETIPPVTDLDTRLTILRSAIDVNNSLKETLAPEASIDKLLKLKSKVFIHLIANLKAAGYSSDDMVVPGLDFRNSQGEPQHSRPFTWVSRFMYGSTEAFLFSHSIADNKNSKPWDMKTMSDNCEALFGRDVQSGKMILISLEPDKTDFEKVNQQQTKGMVEFVDNLWKRSFEVIDAVVTRKRPDKYPKWYTTGVSATPAIQEVCSKSQVYFGEWTRAKRKLHL